MAPIVTLTMNPALDTYLSVKLLESGRKIRSGLPRIEPGGGGLNVARAVTSLGGPAHAFYTCGGRAGANLKSLLAEDETSTCCIVISGETRENINILEESTGQVYRVVTPGPTLTDDEWQNCFHAVTELQPKPEFIIASGSLPPGVPPDFYGRLAVHAREKGIRLIVDSSGDALHHAVDVGVFLLKPTLYELSRLSGHLIKDRRDQEEVGRKIVGKGTCDVLVLSLGAAGVLTITRDDLFRFHAPTVRPVSKIGAGDSLVAGIVLKLHEGASLREAVRYGVACGTAAVLTPGSSPCRPEDVQRLLGQITKEV